MNLIGRVRTDQRTVHSARTMKQFRTVLRKQQLEITTFEGMMSRRQLQDTTANHLFPMLNSAARIKVKF